MCVVLMIHCMFRGIILNWMWKEILLSIWFINLLKITLLCVNYDVWNENFGLLNFKKVYGDL